ncbi:MAG: RNase adapter RapZ [Synergistetes bacterium]|nr:RNase adapter RapZ [Synergistota bacterium]MCX8128207.1 RNase adapter RapZ [Synergistota bacterium]MDW8192654.1 RNase adapter RapZ [Synergistota bacterium]
MQLIVITGFSGAGKSLALRSLEDIGYFCIDNLPPLLIPKLVELSLLSRGLEKIALVIDIRGRDLLPDLKASLSFLRERGIAFKVIFLEASDEVIIRRFEETRRPHPLQNGLISLREAIEEEKTILKPLRDVADLIIDTSNMPPAALKNTIKGIVVKEKLGPFVLLISIYSFGFKYGIPLEADLVFDLRFLPNPYYSEELRNLSGLDKKVQSFILSSEVTQAFLNKLYDLLNFLMPKYFEEGKSYVNIAFGCTGGKHRSVVVAEEVAGYLRREGYPNLKVVHRDINKE